MLPALGASRPWTDPGVVGLHRRPMHVPLHGFERRWLDGRWSLELFDHPDEVPGTALTGERRRAVTVAVPGNWTMQDLGGFEDGPHYTNIQLPFAGSPPALPERVPTGVYRRSFTVPAAWSRGGPLILHVAGAESVHAVFLNGALVGYGTDSRLPSEYDLRPAVRAGRNELAIVVLRYSAQTYVEDQDQWWMAGLHRSVWLERRPAVHLADLPLTGDWDPDAGRGVVDGAAVVEFDGGPEPGWTVRATLLDPDGAVVGEPIEGEVPHRDHAPYVFRGHRVPLRWEVAGAWPWSAERPDRYTVVVELVDRRGRTRQVERPRVGLRRVEVRDRALLVNGRPIWIFGVDRHDHEPDRGTAVTADDIRADLVAMRAHNITAVRTSHYPNDDVFYDLCDELGFYVVDEANLEAHEFNTSLCDDPRYRATWLERGARMVQRDRGHACVIVWSLGNESGYGVNHDALAAWIRATDPSRPLHYEGAVFHDGWVDGGRLASDIVCPMYPTIDAIRAYGEAGDGDRPLIMCEYSHAMGNSNGGLVDYWDAIVATPGLQGGFLWEWKDHSLRQRLPDGRTRLAYGGQFGDEPHDGNFVADGLMSAELEPHPALREVAWVHRPVVVTAKGRGLRIENRRSFTGLEDLRAEWEQWDGDRVVAQGELDVPTVAPGATVTVPRPAALASTSSSLLTVRWRTRADAWFAPAGHLVAWDQLTLGRRTLRLGSDTNRQVATSPDELVEPRLTLWRAPIDNDGFKLMPELARRLRVGGVALARWQDQGLDQADPETLVHHEVAVDRDPTGTTYRHVVDVPEALVDLPRIGVRFALPGRFDRVRWFGRGPHENYPDRCASATLGVWEQDPDELPYLIPQEYGLRCDCRWLELIDTAAGETVRVEALGPGSFHASATHHTAEALTAASGPLDLVRSDDLIVHLDAFHRGLGTASCGPDVDPRYRSTPGRFELAYRVTRLRR